MCSMAGVGNDTLTGGAGNDTLLGGRGADKLLGEAGTDTLQGGFGADTLTGGTEADTFRFDDVADSRLSSGFDTITDFVAGVDKINLSQVDANAPTDANEAFTFIGSAAFSGVAGQLRFAASGGGHHGVCR